MSLYIWVSVQMVIEWVENESSLKFKFFQQIIQPKKKKFYQQIKKKIKMSIQNCVDCLAYQQIPTATRITKKDKIRKVNKKQREHLGCEYCKYIIFIYIYYQ